MADWTRAVLVNFRQPFIPGYLPAIETGVRVTSLIEKPPDGAVDVDPGEAVERSARFYRTDFVRRDAENRQLGRLGEE